MAADAKPSIEALLELLKATADQELACLKSDLGKIIDRYEKIRTLNLRLFLSPLLDDVTTVWDRREKED
ncbi:MAG: hypothetical protein IID06_04800 [Gemmatimonadetes bacterium]|nr:hypothetical protein [Gemmatimonadota bacterium]